MIRTTTTVNFIIANPCTQTEISFREKKKKKDCYIYDLLNHYWQKHEILSIMACVGVWYLSFSPTAHLSFEWI